MFEKKGALVEASERRLLVVLGLIDKNRRKAEDLERAYFAERKRLAEQAAGLRKERSELEKTLERERKKEYSRLLALSAENARARGIPADILADPGAIAALERYLADKDNHVLAPLDRGRVVLPAVDGDEPEDAGARSEVLGEVSGAARGRPRADGKTTALSIDGLALPSKENNREGGPTDIGSVVALSEEETETEPPSAEETAP